MIKLLRVKPELIVPIDFSEVKEVQVMKQAGEEDKFFMRISFLKKRNKPPVDIAGELEVLQAFMDQIAS